MPHSFPHRHLLDIESLAKADIEVILALAARYADVNRSAQKKSDLLHGKTVVNLFFENSTRTRTSFEIAAKRLGADVINVPLAQSSTQKGETLLDTVLTLDAMQIDGLVIRHAEDGVPHALVPHVQAHIINAGDGKHEHPTQGLLDALTILRHKKKLEGLTVAICGDISHSRVAQSIIRLLVKFDATVRLIAPPYFAPSVYGNLGVSSFEDMNEGLKDADVVMVLRIQRERMVEDEYVGSLDHYHKNYGLNHARLAVAKPDVIVMNPGPIPRGIEVTSELADDPLRSVILEQVEMGVAVRMAVMELLLGA